MARVELPQSRLRIRRRKRRVRIALLALALVLLLGAGAAGLTHIPALQVTAVAVSGVQTVSSSTVVAQVQRDLAGSYAYLFPKRNIFIYPKRLIASHLQAAHPPFARVEVYAQDFNTIAVQVVERAPRALWCGEVFATSSQCYFADEGGVVYAEAPGFSSPVYTAYYGILGGSTLNRPAQFLEAGDFAALSALVDAVIQKIPGEELAGVSVDTNKDVQMRFMSGFALRFALGDKGGDVFERFVLALGSEPFTEHALEEFEYLDLRFGDKLYYKLKNE